MKKKNEISEAKIVVQDFAETSLEVSTSMILDNLPELGMAAADIIGNIFHGDPQAFFGQDGFDEFRPFDQHRTFLQHTVKVKFFGFPNAADAVGIHMKEDTAV